jgi:DNA polymerase (family 10)
VENAEVARLLREVADLLELQSANAFRIRAYRTAARAVEELPESVEQYVASGNVLSDLPGIGKDLAQKIEEIATRGSTPLLEQLHRSARPGEVELMHVRGIGPKRARILSRRLGVRSVKGLVRAAKQGRVRRLSGFGARIEEAILREIGAQAAEGRRTLRSVAAQYGAALLDYLREDAAVRRSEIAGSFRRCCETVGDLDVLVAAMGSSSVVTRFIAYPECEQVLERGRTRAAIRLRSGLRVDLRVVPERSFGAALHYFTGSKAHNIAVRQMARERGLKLNEYGVFRGRQRVAGGEEADVFSAVRLPWIPPEIRENAGELQAAATGNLPKLITLSDIRGDLQSHTTDSDGRDTLEDMALAAGALGYEYLAITDHTPALQMIGGLDAAGFRKQWRKIDGLNRRLKRLTLLRGAEVDIHPDGTLDLGDKCLAGFDIVLASIHGAFSLSAKEQTRRVLRAIQNPHVDVFAHPTSRLIGRRAAIELDLDQIIRAAVDAGVWLELDAQPERLDLDDSIVRRAVSAGATVAIDSDAHSRSELAFMRWGVDQARRGWLEPAAVANTWPLKRLLKNLRRAQ